MDRHRSIKNVVASVSSRVLLLAGSILVRRLLIHTLGNGVNGIHSLYVSIVGFLSLTELGIGSAISYCMYRPIVDGDRETVQALYTLFKRAYTVIGVSAFALGSAVSLALPYLAKGYEDADVSLYPSYFIMLISVSVSYLYGARISLINAHKNDYISTLISSLGMLVQYGLQALVLVYTASFEKYLACQLATSVIVWAGARAVTKRKYADIVTGKALPLNRETEAEVKRSVTAMLMHKVGGVLVNSTDSIIISSLIGVEILGRYTNYSSVINNMTALLSLLFSSLVSVIGHTFISERQRIKLYFDKLYFVNFAVGVFFFLGFYATADGIISLLFGDGLEISRTVLFVLSLNYFIWFMRQSVLAFRDGTGQFYKDRWKPALEGSVNLVLSLFLAIILKNTLGDSYAVAGVIIATVVTNLLICHIAEPYVLFRYGFGQGAGRHIVKNYGYIALFTVALILTDRLTRFISGGAASIIVNGAISVLVAMPVVAAAFVYEAVKHRKK